jgi:hypothetical protein
MNKFDHIALGIKPADKVVFAAISKKNFYMRMLVSKFVLDQGAVPINPFMSFDYFMADIVERDVVRRANNTLVDRADELWVFGDISDGVQAEIVQVEKKGKVVRYFEIHKDRDFIEINKDSIKYE